ncbi:uncharacterized protein LOC131945091 isoform X2 [Physella acuta]|uniref:uncharacterized protein LOC131945091 isoform X2 n=1 Tax=Physella acuta TaxID=109671 RepID=UPI0027DCEC50|nr:uncharacterized protein LOC131945091 isoform X2 [Physella acuta]
METEADEDKRGGNYQEAIVKYSQLLQSTSKSKEEALRWLCARGECYLELSEWKKALEDGKNALDAARRSEDGTEADEGTNQRVVGACVLCGMACSQLEMFLEALDYFKDGLKKDPKNKQISGELKKLQNIIMKEQKEHAESQDCTYSAVSLCSQSIYPGDEQLINMEKEILAVKYKILDDEFYKGNNNHITKDAQLETQLVQAAYECLTMENLNDSLILISKAVAMDPSNVFYRTFRAQVYFNLKQWHKVIQDYWIIPKSMRKPDVWKQGGKALMELWLPVLAEFWFRKATQLTGGKDEEAAILFQKVRVKRLYDPLTEDQPVRVDFTQFGRAVFAKRDIAKGQTVMTDIPMVMAQSLGSRHIPACCNCAVSLITPKDYFGNKLLSMGKDQLDLIEEFWPSVAFEDCPHCHREKYCSKLCRIEAWDNYHRIICPSLNPAASQIYDICENKGYGYTSDGQWTEVWGGHYSPMILIKIWSIILSQVRDLMEKESVSAPTVEHWAKARAPFRRFIAYGTIPAIKRMPHMLPIFQSVFADCGSGLKYNINEEEFNGRYYQAACNLQCFSPSITPYHRFLDNIKEDIRAVGMLKYLSDRPPEAQFAAMCPLHACSNHSCFNNAEVCDLDIDGRPGIQMIARRDIKEGEEVFITYIDTAMPKLLRKAWLYKSFNFWCSCQRCQFEGEQPNECTNCHKKAPEGKNFSACGKCKKAWYCGVACQKDAWKKGHKVVCLTDHSQTKFPV